MDGDHVGGEDAKPDDDGVDELEPRLRATVEPADLGQRNDAKAEAEEDGEDEHSTWNVVAPDVAEELTVRHQVIDRVAVLLGRHLQQILYRHTHAGGPRRPIFKR